MGNLWAEMGGIFQVTCSDGSSMLASLFSAELAFMFSLLLGSVKENDTISQKTYLMDKKRSFSCQWVTGA